MTHRSLRFAAAFVTSLSIPFIGQAQPVDNPIISHYGPGLYDWTEAINWSSAYSILDYGGDNTGAAANDSAYVAARDAASSAGGGVVYFPAGEYRFNDSINVVDTVVLRGDTPAVTDAKDSDYRPPSKLVFPKFNFVASGNGTDPDTAFKGIGMSGSGVNTGLVHLDVNRASIRVGGSSTSSENVIVFGVRSNNVASEQPWTVPTPEQNPWQIHPYRFADNISVDAYRNALVANCRINDAHYWLHRQDDGKDLTGAPADLASLEIDDFEQPGYLIKDGSVWRTLEEISGKPYVFEYTDHYGIDLRGSSGKTGAAPWEQPNLFYTGAVIRDNWVYTTMRVKIDASGRGLIIKDNTLLDRSGKQRYYDPNGEKRVGNSATLENRGIDWRGHDVLIEGNEIEVRRHLLNGGPYGSVDGEAILHQEIHGTTIDGITIRNNTANAYIGLWKMPYIRNVLIEDNRVTGSGFNIIVESDTNGRDYPMYGTVVRNNIVDGNIDIRADYYSPGVLSANVYDNQVDGTLEIEDHAIHSGNTRQDGVTPATVDTKTGATAITPPAEGILYADADTDALNSGDTVNFTVLVTTPSLDVERVKFYRNSTLLKTDAEPPYTFEYVSGDSRFVWSAKIEQPQQPGGFNPYTALLVDPDPAWSGPPSVVLSGPDPAGPFVAPATLDLSAAVTPGANPVDRVEFYSGGTYLGEGIAGSQDYTFSWSDVAFGTYQVTAKVWDTGGAVVVSEPVLFDILGAPDAAPTGLQATTFSDTEIDLSWSNAASNADGFDIQRSPAGSGTWATVDTVTLPATTYRDSGLSPETGYDYRVLAINTYGSSNPGTKATATTFPSGLVTPGAPERLKARALNTSGMKLDWAPPGSGTVFGYRVESAADPAGIWTTLADLPGSITTHQISGLTPGERAYFRVRAWNNIGNSAWAETSGVTLTAESGFADTFSEDGLPWEIPGRIEFADYNPGAYFDTTSGNEGTSNYRSPDSVDMGGNPVPTIGWIASGEWMEYTVRIDQAGLYTVDIRYASPNTYGSLSLKIDGENIAPAITFPSTGSWNNYQKHTVNGVYLPAGHYTLRAYMENSGFNLAHVTFTLAEAQTYTNWSQANLGGHPASGSSDNADGDLYPNILDMVLGLDPLALDGEQTDVTVQDGWGTFRFPIAKGLDTTWSVKQATDLSAADPWTQIPEGSISVIAEEADRVWMEAKVPEPPAGSLFFTIEASP